MKSTLRTLGLALALGIALPTIGVGCGDATTGDAQNVTEGAGRFEIFQGEDNEQYFQLLASNGEKLLRSEGYKSLSGAKNGVQSVKGHASGSQNFDILDAVNGETYFNLVASNGQVIGTSETYGTRAAAEAGVDAVQRAAASASIKELLAGGPKFQSFEGADGQTYFRLRAANGQIVLQSEGYTSDAGADAGIDAVKANGADAANYNVLEASNGQSYFTLQSPNGETIGHGELYASKYNAERGAETVRRIVRELTGSTASDADIKTAVEAAADGLLYTSEGDYPYMWVEAPLNGETEITEALVREKMAQFVDNDPDADKPLADLFADEGNWDDFGVEIEQCAAEQDDDYYYENCIKKAALDRVLGENLSDIKVFYFGSYGEPGYVDGVAVSIIIVGISPAGNMVGVRTIAIWT